MRVLLLNPPHTAIGSRIPDDHLPPLGLLALGGPLIDAGHDVSLYDADLVNARLNAIVHELRLRAPDVLLIGHSGSTSAHPTVVAITRVLRLLRPAMKIVYGGVYPTYHGREILAEEPQIDVIVRGEGEATVVSVVNALANGSALSAIPGVWYRDGSEVRGTEAAEVSRDLDSFRVGWELIDHADYSYWGRKRAVVVQFSRGCPHPCTYCGQRGFWTRWRHRDPVLFAREIARLHREHGVEVFNLADENPTSSRTAWKAFLEALIAENVNVTLVGSTRADDIVRDADLLHLYRKAGVERFLMGMEHTDARTLAMIRKGATTATDREAIRLLRVHGILSMATYVVGFEEEKPEDLLRGLMQLISYDPDQVQLLYVTPHRWTPYYKEVTERVVIQPDPRRWDYKHQVLATRSMKPWQVLACVKAIEVAVQMRPRAIWRLLREPDPKIRHARWWYYVMGRRVWFSEVWSFLVREKRLANGPTVRTFWGDPMPEGERSMRVVPLRRRVVDSVQGVVPIGV